MGSEPRVKMETAAELQQRGHGSGHGWRRRAVLGGLLGLALVVAPAGSVSGQAHQDASQAAAPPAQGEADFAKAPQAGREAVQAEQVQQADPGGRETASGQGSGGAARAENPHPQTGGVYCVGVLYRIRAGHEAEAMEDLRRLAAATRREAGNLFYAVHRSATDTAQFLIYEQYRSRADLELHQRTDYFQRYSVQGLQKIAESRSGGPFVPF